MAQTGSLCKTSDPNDVKCKFRDLNLDARIRSWFQGVNLFSESVVLQIAFTIFVD